MGRLYVNKDSPRRILNFRSVIQIEQGKFPGNKMKPTVHLGWLVKYGEEYSVGLVSLYLCITVSYWSIYVSP